MADPTTIIAGVGIGLGVVGQVLGTVERQKAARREQKLREGEADEVLRRAQINVGVAQTEAELLIGDVKAGFASSGFSASSSELILLENVQSRIDQDINNIRSEAEFRARQIRAGAQGLAATARNIGIAGAIGAGGTLLTRTLGLIDKSGIIRSGADPFDVPDQGGPRGFSPINPFTGFDPTARRRA